MPLLPSSLWLRECHPRKDDMIPFPFNENRFSFLLQTIYSLASCVQIPRVIGAFYHVWKWHNVQRARSVMLRCTTHALYLSKLWQQGLCQHPKNANLDGSTCQGWWKESFRLRLWSLVWFQKRATSCNLTSLKSAWKSTPKCTWMSWRLWWFLGAIRWPVADPGCGAGPQVQRHPGLASEVVLRLCTHLSLAPSSSDLNPLDFFVWSYVENITNMTSYNTKASLITAFYRVFTKLPPALLEKTCSQFRIRIEVVIEADGGYIE